MTAAPAAASADAMEARRFKYRRLSVIAELGILVTEAHLGIHSDSDRHAVLHRGAETPLLEMTHGALVRFGRQRPQDPDDPGRTVLLQHDVEHHRTVGVDG